VRLIPLTKNFSAKVDDSIYDYLMKWKWHYNCGYAERKEYRNGKQYHIQMHRVILPIKGLVDHINGDTLDNRKSNLRISNHSTNAMNMRKHKGASVYKGVSREGNIWRTQIWKDNKKVFSVSTKEERHAALVYDLNAPALFGEYARLNFPEATLVYLEQKSGAVPPVSPQ
jgi:hypothetical protein